MIIVSCSCFIVFMMMGFLCRTNRGINTLVNFGSFYWFGVICDVVFCWRDLAMWWVTHRLSVTNVDTRSDKMYSKSRGGRRLHNSGRRLFWPSDYFQRVMQRAPIAWPASIWWYFWCEPCENAVQTVWAQMGAGSVRALGTLSDMIGIFLTLFFGHLLFREKEQKNK